MAQSLGEIERQQKQLEQKRAKLEEEIAFTKKRISDIKSKRSTSLSELNTLKRQLKVREELIGTIRSQVAETDRNIRQRQTRIKSLENEIAAIKRSYSRMIYSSYVHHTQRSNLLFVFSSESINEAVRRVDYVKAYQAFKREQANRISKSREELLAGVKLLEDARKQKADLLAAEVRNRNELKSDRDQVTKQVNDFQKQESKYAAEVKAKEKAKSKLNNQIEALIAEAIKRKEKAAKASTTSSGKATTAMAATKEATELSTQFAANKGKLPWPVEKGYITAHFGQRYLPELKMHVENNGIDIATDKGATVRAIFNGEVTNTFFSPVFKYGVLVSHGNYFTVYTGLDRVVVKENDKVSTKQQIGVAHTKEETNVTEIHLEVWQSTTKLNPALWIYR
jgi:septal ring factor EnvC (AmiA/AmiB activator)